MGLFELIYYVGYRLKTGYDLRRQQRIPAKVISIGNITSGGTGKTPATVAVALEARNRGLSPCVLTRGYKGSLQGPIRVTGDMKAGEAGDEPILMARRLGDIPVIKCADRFKAGMYALNNLNPTPNLFVLDDGFQHRRLYRDKDILLINSRNPFAGGKLLPVGLLREPLGQMNRADIIVITKKSGNNSAELKETIRRYNSEATIYDSGYRLSSVIDASGEKRSVDWLKGKDVFALCGIGEPGSFRDSLVSAGARLKGFRAFGDHYRFTQGDIRKISNEAHVSGAPWIITTEKDIMRLQGLKTPENLLSLEIDFVVEEGFFDEAFK